MSDLVYIETNFIMAIASGRDSQAEAFLSNPSIQINILMPSICYMEALIAKFSQACPSDRAVKTL